MIKQKKAVSLIISYTLLIVIAVSISILVYSYLNLYLPSDRPECKSGTALIIQDVSCSQGRVYMDISNRGLFSVQAFYARMSKQDREVRTQLNAGNEILFNPLKPGEITSYSWNLPTGFPSQGEYTVEIQPAIFKERVLFPCKDAIVTQDVTCIEE